MRIIFVITFFCLVSIVPVIYAQDVIIKTDGEEIYAKVIEVGEDVVKYERFDNESGLIYIITKADIFMIKYENGEKDIFQTTNPSIINIIRVNNKNPVFACVLSLVYPSLGQFYNGQKMKGIIMITIHASSSITIAVLMSKQKWSRFEDKLSSIALWTLIGNYLWSIIDAPISANTINRRNQALTWNLGDNRTLSITPNIVYSNSIGTNINYHSPAYGLSLKLDF